MKISSRHTAAGRAQATAVPANVRQLAGGRPVGIAPLVARLTDPAVLEKLRGADAGKTVAFSKPEGRV